MEITYSQGKQNKIHISIDGEYKFTVDAEYWYSCPYCRVKEITDSDECDEFLSEIGSRCAYISGLRLLSYSDNTRSELKRKLILKGHKAECVENALDKLEDYGYINDMRFAQVNAEIYMTRKHMSKSRIRSELSRKGVPQEIITQVLENLEFDPASSIDKLIQTKYKRYLGDEKGVRKTIAALQRLGYGWSDIKSAINRYNPDTEDDFYD